MNFTFFSISPGAVTSVAAAGWSAHGARGACAPGSTSARHRGPPEAVLHAP